jgi:hypothetical protein
MYVAKQFYVAGLGKGKHWRLGTHNIQLHPSQTVKSNNSHC